MPLTSTESDAAQQAFQRLKEQDQLKEYFWSNLPVSKLASLLVPLLLFLVVIGLVKHDAKIYIFFIPLLGVLLGDFFRWRRGQKLKASSADDFLLLKKLRKKNGGPFAFENLAYKQALLWRVDQFLSGKGWSGPTP